VRRFLLGVGLCALLAAILAAPALALSAAREMPANEILIAKNLKRLGLIPRYATPEMAQAAVQALGIAGPREGAALRPPAGARWGAANGLKRFLRAQAGDPSATDTYVTNTLVLLVEFADADWPSGDSSGHDIAGPQHGEIGPPAADDNATFWPGDFSRMHYQQMLFGNSFNIYDASGAARGSSDDTMRNYYLEMSHGTYTVDGQIMAWVQLPYPESWYGADSASSHDNLNGARWRIARDAVQAFAAANPGFDYSAYDNENPWGLNSANDYAFNEPDGYIDHLILVHAGADQSAGGGAQGDDSIWAHSWWIDATGGDGMPGLDIPGTAGQGLAGGPMHAYTYTINPEDGDIGVFCHEFGHDLGLPDQYDYTGPTGDASSGFWTLMSSGSWLGRQWGIGTKPAPMNVWDKYALGFITPKTVARGKTATVKLQPAAVGDAKAVGVKIELPKRKHVIQLSGKDGAMEWYSDFGNNLDNTLTTTAAVAVPAGSATLTMRTWYDIEQDYDYGYVNVSSDDGAHWTSVQSPATVDDGTGRWGLTGTDTSQWAKTMTYDLSAFAGQSVLVQFEYATDPGVAPAGWEITDVKVGGVALPETAFTSDGWKRVDGETSQMSDQYYIAEYRTYDGFDEGLKNCYQWNYDYSSWVDWYRYGRGLHLIYRDTFWSDNDVSARGGGNGGWNVLDARPIPDGVGYNDGVNDVVGYWRPRIQVRDAAFSVKPTPTQSIYFVDYDAGWAIGENIAPGKLAQPWFNDTWKYWYPEAPDAGVKIPAKLGVRIQVKSMNADGMTIWVDNVK
jgi:immune inhibitor A